MQNSLRNIAFLHNIKGKFVKVLILKATRKFLSSTTSGLLTNT